MNELLKKHRYKILPAFALVTLVVLIVAFHRPLRAWFFPPRDVTNEPAVPKHVHGTAPAASAEATLAKIELPPAALSSLETAFSAYEEIRSTLAHDSIDGVAPAARRIEQALHAAAQNVKDAPKLAETLHAGADAAKTLSSASKIEPARMAFGNLSRALVLIASADQRLAKGKHVFECPMAKGYKKWIQPSEQMANPYMGEKMLMCGSETQLAVEPPKPTAGSGSGSGEISHWTCPMHPSVRRAGPGQCPICNMDLVPVTKQEVETGVIIVDAARRQLIGVKTAKVEKKTLEKSIRAVGKITYDETRVVDVTLKFKGYIGQLFADATGKRVKKGQALLTVYSPEVYQAQLDMLIARGGSSGGGLQGGQLLESAKRRLELWDVPRGTIERVLSKGEPMRYVPIASPASGYIVAKNVFAGSAVEPGMQLMRIANLDKVWIEAELYEAELPLIKVGQPVSVSLPYLPDARIPAKISFIYPYLSGETRTGRVRIELPNKKVELKPDMYANVELEIDRGERLVVPESAVIYAGPRRLVFVDLGEGKLKPQEIQVGIKTGDYYEVSSGLREGDRIVTSGNFLIAAESRLKSATGQW